jgi:predicted dehydrogenase
MAKQITRRTFLKGTTAAVVASQVKKPFHSHNPNYALANSKLNIAAIGAGGKGWTDINGCAATENIVALADVDHKRAAKTFGTFDEAKQYFDFREMLDKHPEIDAVTVSTPDHCHTIAADLAMSMGKHVYVQKPLTYTVAEARHLRLKAAETGVITQMGNQGHSWNGARQMCEMIWSGAIGDVTEAHIWTNRPVWPQGIPYPTVAHTVPDTLDWDLWQGPAKKRDYNRKYLPFNWRGWWEYGCGALGDMACHIADPANMALNLSSVGPTSVELVMEEGNNKATYPHKAIIKYEFPARGDQPPLSIYWYSGGNKPARPKDIPENNKLGDGDNGTLFIGTDGYATCDTYGDNARLLPDSKMKNYTRPEETIARVQLPGDEKWRSPYAEWINGIKTDTQPGSNFEYSGPFTEWVVMGNLSLRFPGQKLEWDAANMRVTNHKKANKFIHRKYHNGWELSKVQNT